MAKPTTRTLKMRRHSDISKLTVAYCVFGIIMGLSQVALSAEEICATTYKEIENSKSQLLKGAAEIIKGKSFRNRSNSAYLEFLDGEQIIATSTSTRGVFDDLPDVQTSVVKICDNAGKLWFTSLLIKGTFQIELTDSCFRAMGFLADRAGDKAIFCQGTMPTRIQGVLEADNRAKGIVTAQRIPIGHKTNN